MDKLQGLLQRQIIAIINDDEMLLLDLLFVQFRYYNQFYILYNYTIIFKQQAVTGTLFIMSLFYANQQKSNISQSNQPQKNKPANPYYNSSSSQYKKPQSKQQHDPTFPNKHSSDKQPQQLLRKSILLANTQQQNESWLTKCCSCANIQNYKKFFSVTNEDVMKRILFNLQFWKSVFFNANEQYDFYGPFWIYTTVVFCLSAVPNILLYQGSNNFQYNFQIVGVAFSFMYIIGFLYPVIMTFIMKIFGVQCTYIQNTCLYGYSMCICIICILLCSLNVCILHYVFLGYAYATRSWFIMNNMFKSYQIPLAKKALITGLIIGENVLQFIVVKFYFVKCYEAPASTNTTGQKHSMQTFYHMRQFIY